MRPDFADTSGRRQRAATEHRGGVTAWLWPITSRPRLPLGEAWMYTRRDGLDGQTNMLLLIDSSVDPFTHPCRALSCAILPQAYVLRPLLSFFPPEKCTFDLYQLHFATQYSMCTNRMLCRPTQETYARSNPRMLHPAPVPEFEPWHIQ